MRLSVLGRGRHAQLTTEHGSSSYWQPVLVIECEGGQARGVAEVDDLCILGATEEERSALLGAGYDIPDCSPGAQLAARGRGNGKS